MGPTDVPNRSGPLVGSSLALLTIAVITIILRIYTRVFMIKSFGLDDWLMLAATASFILFVSCAMTGVHYGTGRHHSDLEQWQIESAMKFWWFCYIWYCVTMITSKMSIGYFLLRITVQKIHRWIIYTVVFLSVFTGLIFFFVTIFQCNPVTWFWYKHGDGMCVDPKIIAALTYLYSAVSVICDFTFALMPLHMISGLQMRQATKYALIPILGMACVASVAVVVRFAYIKDFLSPDFLWATTDIAIWSMVEQGLAIAAGSLATLQPLFRLGKQKLGFGSSHMPATGGSQGPHQTIGGGAARGTTRTKKSMFSLTTFNREDEFPEEADPSSAHQRRLDIESGGQDDGGSDVFHHHNAKSDKGITYTTTVTVKKERNSMWRPSGSGPGNESEEELTSKPSKETLNDTRIVIPRGPLDSESHDR